jgi:uncharacterized caspase-like protein
LGWVEKMPIKALIIAPTYEEIKDEWSSLLYTQNDAERFKEFLIESLGVSHNNVICLDAKRNGTSIYETWKSVPDIDNMVIKTKKIMNNFKKGDTFVFFFSGHGIEQNGIKLIPQFCLKNNVNRTAFDLKNDLLKHLENMDVNIHTLFIIDACRSISGVKGDSLFSDSLHELLKKNKITGILACSKGEVSKENDDLKMGIFTHFVIESFEKIILENKEYDIQEVYLN